MSNPHQQLGRNGNAFRSDPVRQSPRRTAWLRVTFNSYWEEGVVSTPARLDLQNGSVSNIKVSTEGADYEHLLSETVDAGGLEADVEASGGNNYRLKDPAQLARFRRLGQSPHVIASLEALPATLNPRKTTHA